MIVTDPRHRTPNLVCHRLTDPVGRITGLPCAAAKPVRRRQFVRDDFDLVAGALGASKVPRRSRLFQILTQVGDALPVCCHGLRVEDRAKALRYGAAFWVGACPIVRGDPERDQIGDVDITAGMGEEMRDVV
jgi:hypothetical protein